MSDYPDPNKILDEAWSIVDQRLAGSRGSHLPTPAPKPQPAEPQVNPITATLSKLGQFSPFERDPSPAEAMFLSPSERQAASDIRDLVTRDGSSMEDRIEAQERWDRLTAEHGQYREQQVRGFFARRLEEQRAAEATRAELAESWRRDQERELRSLGERAANLRGGELFQEAAATGAIDLADDELRKAGFNNAARARMSELRESLVEVDPHGRIQGEGFQTMERDGKTFAYPAHIDRSEFADLYGVGAREEPTQGDQNDWRFDPSL